MLHEADIDHRPSCASGLLGSQWMPIIIMNVKVEVSGPANTCRRDSKQAFAGSSMPQKKTMNSARIPDTLD